MRSKGSRGWDDASFIKSHTSSIVFWGKMKTLPTIKPLNVKPAKRVKPFTPMPQTTLPHSYSLFQLLGRN